MTVWSRATCDDCETGVGLEHPIFTTRRDRPYPWTSFVVCPICAQILCLLCAPESGCPRCDHAYVEDEFPEIWLRLKRSVLNILSHCIACRLPTRPGDACAPPDPAREGDARWYACLACARELCESCAVRRLERCVCGERAVLRGVPAARAYLPAWLRTELDGLALPQQIARLEDERARVVARFYRGECLALEGPSSTWAIDLVLAENGAKLVPAPWEIAASPPTKALVDEVLEGLAARGFTAPAPVAVGLFADLDWKPDYAGRVAESAFGFTSEGRYVVLHRYPDGIRYGVGHDPPLEDESAEVGYVLSVEDAAHLVVDWLSGMAIDELPRRRHPAP